MLTKNDVRSTVHALLREDATAAFLSGDPDAFYGWVKPKTLDDGTVVPGYWLGTAEKAASDHAVAMARIDHERTPADLDLAERYAAAVRARDALEHEVEHQITFRREVFIERRVAKEFITAYRKASVLNWNLYHPAIPEDLREYVQRQRARGAVAPTSVVLLYLLVQSTIEHGRTFQVNAPTGENHLVNIPLARTDLDIEAVENEPSKQRRQYIKALQAVRAAETRAPAHANGDRRDALADFEYHGLPEQLGALWIDKADGCPTCGQPLQVKMVHAQHGFRYATVCANYRKGCTNIPKTPIYTTRRAVRDHAVVEWACAS